jgi:hypothetical protein
VLDLIESTKFFVTIVVNQWPVPFSLREARAIVLSAADSSDGDLTLAVLSEAISDSDRWLVQVDEPGSSRSHLAVRLAEDGRFLSGSHFDSPVDELGAADALALYAPFIRGEWRAA